MVGDLGWVVPVGQETGHSCAHARAGDVIEVQAGAAKNVDHPHVRVAPNAPGAEREPYFEPGQIAGRPADLPTRGRAQRKGPAFQLVLLGR